MTVGREFARRNTTSSWRWRRISKAPPPCRQSLRQAAGRIALIVAALLIPLITVPTYLKIGSPEPDRHPQAAPPARPRTRHLR